MSISSRRSWCLLASASLVIGCSGNPPPHEQPRAPSSPVTQPSQSGATTRPDSMDASAGSAEALARKTATYAQSMESLLSKHPSRSDAPPSPGVAAPLAAPELKAVEPSVVRWADPSDLTLSLTPDLRPTVRPAIEAGATLTPVIDSAPISANRVASLARNATPVADSATPQIVPEGHDDPAPVRAAATVSTDALEQKLARQVKEYPRDVAAHLDYQLLRFLQDESVPQLATLASLPGEDREALTALLDGLSNFRSTLRRDNNLLLSRKIRPIMDMADRMRSQAELSIPTVALCSRVDGFGVYEPIDPPRFVAHREQQVIVYCEVANFSAQLSDKKLWETKLTLEAVLYTDTGLPVWEDKGQAITDLSRNRRHDFFVVKKTKLPSGLTIGRYLLKISITDQQASRVAETSVPIQIVAQ